MTSFARCGISTATVLQRTRPRSGRPPKGSRRSLRRLTAAAWTWKTYPLRYEPDSRLYRRNHQVTTTRSLRDEVRNVLDYLSDAELTLYTNAVSMSETRVAWHAHQQHAEFLITRQHTYEQYLNWVESGSYSAILRDASLLQISYEVRGGKIVAHRLAYVPCPCITNQDALDAFLGEGSSISDIVNLNEYARDVVFRSPIRFDYDTA